MIQNKNVSLILKGEFGLERENVRVTAEGSMVKTPHPKAFGSKNTNKYIKTDFAESQLELITPIFNSIDETYAFLGNLQKITSLNLENEYLWPQSNPPILPQKDEDILVAQYGNDDTTYREHLAKKYGTKRSIFSGIHFNFSFHEDALNFLCDSLNINKESSNNIYLKLIKYVTKYNWLFVYLTGASPIFHESFKDDKGMPNVKNVFSFRNSEYGYKNLKDYILNYNSIEEYNNSIENLVKTKELARVSELYMPIRLKNTYRENNTNKQINYIELRFVDLNPMFKLGVSKQDLHMLHLLLVCFSVCEDFNFDEEMQKAAYYNRDQVALYGKTKILNNKNELVPMEEEALKLISAIEGLNLNDMFYVNILNDIKEKINDITKTYSHIIGEEIKQKGYVNYHMDKAKEYLEKDRDTEYKLDGYQDMELSTQSLLQSVIKKGLAYKVLDKSQNFICVQYNGKTEYIKEATKTSADNYSTVLVMENKHITKLILDENKIKTPAGVVLNYLDEGIKYYEKTEAMPLVIKPNNTNFGKGITILNKTYSFEDYEKALKMAFKEDSVVLVEEFITGKEYRFLVIGDKVEAALHRRAASVLGDGVSTITQLVEIKNRNPLRSIGYKTPLEKIKLGEVETDFLQKQGLTINYVPPKDERVFLRENSNISTGGDSIDFTDTMHSTYNEIAINAAKCVGAKICGVDMMVNNLNEPANNNNHAIIELNFNPAIQIHCYPSEGKRRRIGDKILELLFNME